MHEKLVERIKAVKGYVILSGYETPVYESLGWTRVQTEALTDSAQGRKAAKTEVLWLNPAAMCAQAQQALF
jgi:hypothetical protein